MALGRAGLGDLWYRWCDRRRDWSSEATGAYEQDSLLTEHGGYTALPIGEFMQAYRTAGATVTRGSRLGDPRHRSFTVEVGEGPVLVGLAVLLGRGLNSQECSSWVEVDGVRQAEPVRLHAVARDLRLSRDETVPGPDGPYPRPIISSRSHLEVSSREIVALIADVAGAWPPVE
ncbi:hypothetical protein SAMN04489747_2440 [Auraticoccus monumenti]|uniref:Uncharacterized protein n=1 Tax=Auraticoccus monumenti TaxID=675864 RepID=A0A1G6ZYE0_9ACTN|nr:hypothetical protein SAMN04489747_2440 [Auraticoccus monumenti]